MGLPFEIINPLQTIYSPFTIHYSSSLATHSHTFSVIPQGSSQWSQLWMKETHLYVVYFHILFCWLVLWHGCDHYQLSTSQRFNLLLTFSFSALCPSTSIFLLLPFQLLENTGLQEFCLSVMWPKCFREAIDGAFENFTGTVLFFIDYTFLRFSTLKSNFPCVLPTYGCFMWGENLILLTFPWTVKIPD